MPWMTSSKTQPACSTPFTSSNSLPTPQVRYAAASSKIRPVTASAQVIPSIKSGFFAPLAWSAHEASPRATPPAFAADEAHISIEVAYHCAQQVRDVFHQDAPAQGRRLAARLIERLPTCPVPEIARLGPDPTQMEGCLHPHSTLKSQFTGEASVACALSVEVRFGAGSLVGVDPLCQ